MQNHQRVKLHISFARISISSIRRYIWCLFFSSHLLYTDLAFIFICCEAIKINIFKRLYKWIKMGFSSVLHFIIKKIFRLNFSEIFFSYLKYYYTIYNILYIFLTKIYVATFLYRITIPSIFIVIFLKVLL